MRKDRIAGRRQFGRAKEQLEVSPIVVVYVHRLDNAVHGDWRHPGQGVVKWWLSMPLRRDASSPMPTPMTKLDLGSDD